jgi:hypothetical protein
MLATILCHAQADEMPWVKVAKDNHMKVATWNLESKHPLTNQKEEAFRKAIYGEDADVWVITETWLNFSLVGYQLECGEIGTVTNHPLGFFTNNTAPVFIIKTSGVLNIVNISTSATGLVTSDVWSSSGVLHIVP